MFCLDATYLTLSGKLESEIISSKVYYYDLTGPAVGLEFIEALAAVRPSAGKKSIHEKRRKKGRRCNAQIKMHSFFSLLIALVVLGSCEAFHNGAGVRSRIPSTLRMAVIQPDSWPGQSAPLGFWDPFGRLCATPAFNI